MDVPCAVAVEEVEVVEAEAGEGEGDDDARTAGEGAPSIDRRHFPLLVHGDDDNVRPASTGAIGGGEGSWLSVAGSGCLLLQLSPSVQIDRLGYFGSRAWLAGVGM